MLKLARYSNTQYFLWKHFRTWKHSTFLGLESSLRVKMQTSAEQLEEENERLKNEIENKSQSSMYQSNQSMGNNETGNHLGNNNKIQENSKLQLKFGKGLIAENNTKMFDKKIFENSRELKEELTLSYLNYIQIQNEELKNDLLKQELILNKLKEKNKNNQEVQIDPKNDN